MLNKNVVTLISLFAAGSVISILLHPGVSLGYGRSLPIPQNYGYGYGYGATTPDDTETVATDEVSTMIEEVISETVVPPDSPIAPCTLPKLKHLRVRQDQRAPVLKWKKLNTNCLATSATTDFHYQIRIQRLNNKLVLKKGGIEKTTYKLKKQQLTSNKKYQFSVRVIMNDGTKTEWSNAKKFQY